MFPQIAPRAKGSHTVGNHGKRQVGPAGAVRRIGLGLRNHLADIRNHRAIAALVEIAEIFDVPYAAAVAPQVENRHNVPLLRKEPDKLLIAPLMFTHAVNDNDRAHDARCIGRLHAKNRQRQSVGL